MANFRVGQRVRFVDTGNPLLLGMIGREAIVEGIDVPCAGCGKVHRARNGDPMYLIKFIPPVHEFFNDGITAPAHHLEPLTPPKMREDIVDAEIVTEVVNEIRRIGENAQELVREH